MNMEKGSSLIDTRHRNRVLVKKLIFREEAISRAEIARTLELTKPTITASVNELLKAGLLQEQAAGEEHQSGAGRHPILLSFRPDCASAIGIELGPYETRGILMNIQGEVRRELTAEAAADDYTKMLDGLEKMVQTLKKEADDSLVGICVGLPGFIDSAQGVIRSNLRKNWIGKALAKDLADRTQLPVMIDNNVRLRATGYDMCMKGQRRDEMFAYLFVSKGIACPIVVQSNTLSGHSYGAGELGRTQLIVRENGQEKLLCAEELAGERGIMQRCQELLLEGRAKRLKEILDRNGRFTIRDVMDLQEQGDAEIREVVHTAIRYLGIALSNAVNLFNPGMVVVDGYLLTSEENRSVLAETARAGFYGLNEEEVRMVFVPYEPRRGAEGAAWAAIRSWFLER